MGRLSDAHLEGSGDLFAPRAFARRGDMATSHAAARKIIPALNEREAAVARAIIDAGEHGAMCDEIVARTGLDKVTVSPRFKPLRTKEIIKAKTDEHGETVKRVGQTVWVKA